MRFSAVVLAAGTSSRMRGVHKLLLPIGGEAAIRRTVRMVLEARPQEVVVVTGYEGRAVGEALSSLPARLITNSRFDEGQMTSVVAGVSSLAKATDAVMICLGDMVLLTSADYCELVDAFAALTDKSILVPSHQGRRGNPVVFASAYLPAILSERCNTGCRKLIEDNPNDVFAFEVTHDRVVTDMDTPEDFARILDRLELKSPR